MADGAWWVPLDLDAWPAVAAALGQPWPIEAIYFDLRWWQHQAHVRQAPRPGRPTLAARWGVSEHVARAAMAAEADWGDGKLAELAEKAAGNAGHQPGSSGAPAAGPTDAEDPPESASPAPADRPARVYLDQETEVPVSAWARAAATRQVPAAEILRGVAEAVQAIRGRVVAPSKSTATPVLRLWRALEQPWPAFVADLVLVAEAAHDCPHPAFANDIRAENWPDGRDRQHDVANICRLAPPSGGSGATWDERLEIAQAWAAAGRPTTGWPAPGRPRANGASGGQRPTGEALGVEANRAWGWLVDQLRTRGDDLPQQLVKDPAKNAAVWAGIDALGGLARLLGAPAHQLDYSRAGFVAAYRAAREAE